MKKYILPLLIALLSCSISFAQTQQGIVKTRGRMVNGKVEPGKRLSGATITLNLGNSLVSSGQGTFSFNVPAGKSYSLVSAKKHGYTLADPEYTRRSFTFSAKNPFYVVLEDEEQRQADINAATRKVRKTLTAQLEKREDEIEELKRQNKLTEKEYQKRLQELYDNQSKSEQLVKEMAERYASTDYDQLDDFNRQVQQYIEEGELQKADSMIQSKGDIKQRIANYRETVAANEKVRKELEQSEAGTAKTYEDLSEDLFHKYEICLQEFKQESALYYLKERADLDTTNVEAVLCYANLAFFQRKFDSAEKYLMMSLRITEQDKNPIRSIYAESLLGELYIEQHDWSKSENLLLDLLYMAEQLFKLEPDNNDWLDLLAHTQSSLGRLYNSTNLYDESKKYYEQALENYEILSLDKPDIYSADLAIVQNGLGALLINMGKDSDSGILLKNALSNIQDSFKKYPDTYRLQLAYILDNMSILYFNMGDYAESEKLQKEVLMHHRILFQQNPDAYRAELGLTLYNLAILYNAMSDYPESERYYLEALKNQEILYAQDSNASYDDYVRTLLSLGVQYNAREDYANSKKYLTEAQNIFRKHFDPALNIFDEHIAVASNLLAFIYVREADYTAAVNTLDDALSLLPTDVRLYYSKGKIQLLQGKNYEALDTWKKILMLNPNFLNDYPTGIDFYDGLKKLGLIE